MLERDKYPIMHHQSHERKVAESFSLSLAADFISRTTIKLVYLARPVEAIDVASPETQHARVCGGHEDAP